MPRKIDTLSQDILNLLTEEEPNTLLWREIVARLWPNYEFRYKDKRTFGIAVSQKLRILKASRSIIHKGDRYGTIISGLRTKQPKILELLSIVIISVFGFVIIQGLSSTALQTANQMMPEFLKILVKIYPYIPLTLAVISITGFLLEAKRLLRDKLKIFRVGSRKHTLERIHN